MNIFKELISLYNIISKRNISLKKLSKLINTQNNQYILKYIGLLKENDEIYHKLCQIEYCIKQNKYKEAMDILNTIYLKN
jgi:hypothetical protein